MRGRRCRRRKPWLAAVLSAVTSTVTMRLAWQRLICRLVCPGGGGVADQHLIGGRVPVYLFTSQREGEVRSVRRQFATHLLGGSGYLLFGGLHHFAKLVFRGFLDPGFLTFGFLFRRSLHRGYFNIHLPQTVLNVGQALDRKSV